MSTNYQSNNFVKWLVIIGDFILLNTILLLVFKCYEPASYWLESNILLFVMTNNLTLLLSQLFFSTIIYRRYVRGGAIIRRITSLAVLQSLLTYILLRIMGFHVPIGWFQLNIGICFFVCLLIKRIIERGIVKLYRESGRNTRSVIFVGSDPELINLYDKMKKDPSLGYDVLGYYADAELGEWTYPLNEKEDDVEVRIRSNNHYKIPIKKLGSLGDFVNGLNNPEKLVLGEDLYLSISRKDKDLIRRISNFCDQKVIRFYYVPVSVESLGLNLKREMLDDVEFFTTHENPLENPINRFFKRAFDITFSLLFLIPTAIIFPLVFVIMKIQSPGPILFKQKRTGIDGKTFSCYKFRSMHVNADADKLQATKDDPRKYPFGNFMRKTNIDELPQFLNVLKGDMSIVGPRPHMLAHTEQYSELIDKYMVRHFVKPGVTGWAQVTGYRGETKELWQMEGRIKRDIWYFEHWSFGLDIRIIWMTVKSIFVHDKNAY